MNPLEEAKMLIAVPSVTGEEGDIARHIEKRFSSFGCRTELSEISGGRFNIYAEIPGRVQSRPGLLFHGHMDTVPPHGMNDPFNPKVSEGQVWGRGSVDQKGGVAAVISAFGEYLAGGRVPEKTIAFIGVIDEESEHRGSMAMKDLEIEADFGIVTEPTGLKVGIGCKGTAPLLLSVKGRAAHGCRPWLGANAVIAGMELTRKIMEMELPGFNLEGIGEIKGSINLGRMEGGRAYNIVADTCSVWFDRRTVPGETQQGALEETRKLIESSQLPEDISARVEIARPDWDWEPVKQRGLLPALSDLSTGDVDRAVAACEAVTGVKPEVYYTAGYNEMDFLINDLGINTIQFGPGDPSMCHTDFERLDIEQLNTCSRVYGKWIELFCN